MNAPIEQFEIRITVETDKPEDVDSFLKELLSENAITSWQDLDERKWTLTLSWPLEGSRFDSESEKLERASEEVYEEVNKWFEDEGFKVKAMVVS